MNTAPLKNETGGGGGGGSTHYYSMFQPVYKGTHKIPLRLRVNTDVLSAALVFTHTAKPFHDTRTHNLCLC